MSVRNRVREVRLSKELTQEYLAREAGVTRQTIGLIEKERYNPTISLCLSLSKILGASLDELFMNEEESDGNITKG